MRTLSSGLLAASLALIATLLAACNKEETPTRDSGARSTDHASPSGSDAADTQEPELPDDPYFEDLWSDTGGEAGTTPRGSGADEEPQYAGPELSIDVLVMESFPEQYAALFKVTTNTGGWKLTLDRVAWEGRTLKAYLTLEAPGIDELVTQALEDHEVRHAAGTKKIERAEAYVRLTRRGEGGVQPYRLAATTD
jgi:hypothetical protein